MSEKTKYQVLARKYRPKSFADLIGQDALVQTISNAIAKDRIAHAYMLTGVRGVGKTSTARIIAGMLNCEKGISVNPCGVCDNCKAIKEGRHIDILEFDAASKTGVDDVREIIDAVRYKPVNARFKIYIIDEVHMFSKAAFNALLKTLEEPPEHAKFIFATTEIRKVPVTILSRCQRFDLKRVDANLLACHFKQIALSENAEIEDEALAIIAKVADGSVRDGLSILDQAIAHSAGKVMAEDVRKMIGLADKMQMFNLFDAIVLGQADKALVSLKDIYDLGADVVVIAQDIMEIIHSIAKVKNLPEVLDNPLISAEEKQKIKDWAQRIEVPTLNLAWQIMLKGLSDLKNAPNVFNALEMLLIKLCFMSDLPDPSELMKKIKNNDDLTLNDVKKKPEIIIKNEQQTNLSISKIKDAANQNRQIKSFFDIQKILNDKKEFMMAFNFANDVHLINFDETGVIEICVTDKVPKDFIPNLKRILTEVSAKDWDIKIKNDFSAPTLNQINNKIEKKNKENVEDLPIIKEVFRLFNGAAIEKLAYIGNDNFIEKEQEEILNNDIGE